MSPTKRSDSQIRRERLESLAQVPFVRMGPVQLKKAHVSFFEVFRQREMLSLLVRRDLKARYKDSALGFVWSLVRPLTQLIIYYVVIGKFLGAARGVPDFAIFIFTGLTIYTFFSEIVVGGTGSIVGNSGLIKKIYLPREIFPLASVGSAMFNTAIQFFILVSATVVFGKVPWGIDLLYVFPSLAIVLLYGTAFALLFSAVNVYLRDIQYLVDVILIILMWASPVVYPWITVKNVLGDGFLLELYSNNPLTLAVLGFQRAMWLSGSGTPAPEFLLTRMGIALLFGSVLLFVFHRIFVRLQGNFAQEL